MPVNPSSVIPTWVNTYYPAFYTAITDQENYAYTNIPADKPNWIPLFTNLANAMTSWQGTNRQSSVSNLISSIYTYCMLHYNFGTDFSQIATMDNYVVFDMNGFITDTLGRPVSYYNDLVFSGTYSSAKISAGITEIGTSSVENNKMSSIETVVQGISVPFCNSSLFVDITTTGSISKTGLGNYIFTTLHYSFLYRNTNVGTLVVPPYIP